jgi:hypothetical protein
MDHAGSTLRSPLHRIRQMSEIRRKYRGCKLNRMLDQNRVQDGKGSKAVEILARGEWQGTAAAQTKFGWRSALRVIADTANYETWE